MKKPIINIFCIKFVKSFAQNLKNIFLYMLKENLNCIIIDSEDNFYSHHFKYFKVFEQL